MGPAGSTAGLFERRVQERTRIAPVAVDRPARHLQHGRDLLRIEAGEPAQFDHACGARIVALEPTDFRAPARAVQLRCLDVQADVPGHFVAGGWFGDPKPEDTTPAPSATVVVRVGIALGLASAWVTGLQDSPFVLRVFGDGAFVGLRYRW